jgi:Flp pilus assembly protein TadB
VARRPAHQATSDHATGERPPRRDSRLDVIIAIALGLAAIVTAGAVYLNEHEEHKATLDFHEATHRLLDATSAGLATPRGRSLEADSEVEIVRAEDHQERAADYTLAEVILATSLFLFGIAGISSRWRIKIGALATASFVFLVAVVVLATV